MLVPWPWRRAGGHSPKTPRHPLPAEDLALKRGKGRQFFSLRFPGKDPRALNLQPEEGKGRGVFQGQERDGNSNTRDVGGQGVKTWAPYKERGPFKRGSRTKGCRVLKGTSFDFLKNKVKAKKAASSVRHPFWTRAIGVKPGEQHAGAVTAAASGQQGENKGGICLHPGLHTGPTRLRPWPGGPHP